MLDSRLLLICLGFATSPFLSAVAEENGPPTKPTAAQTNVSQELARTLELMREENQTLRAQLRETQKDRDANFVRIIEITDKFHQAMAIQRETAKGDADSPPPSTRAGKDSSLQALLDWESLVPPSDRAKLSRAKVPGGWLIVIFGAGGQDSFDLMYYPDAGYRWSEKSP